MAHIAADGSKWTNASQARKVPGKAQGDGKQPVSRFSKPEAPRAATAEPATASASKVSPEEPEQDNQADPAAVVASHGHAQSVEINHQDGDHTVTSKHPDGHEHHSKHGSAEEAHSAAGTLAGVAPTQEAGGEGNPAAAMM